MFIIHSSEVKNVLALYLHYIWDTKAGPEVIIFIIWRLFPLLGGYFHYLEVISIVSIIRFYCVLYSECHFIMHAFVTVLQDLMFVEHLSHDFYDMVSQYLPSPPLVE